MKLEDIHVEGKVPRYEWQPFLYWAAHNRAEDMWCTSNVGGALSLVMKAEDRAY